MSTNSSSAGIQGLQDDKGFYVFARHVAYNEGMPVTCSL